MFCGQCGTQNPDTNQFCINCGKPFKKTLAATLPSMAQTPATPLSPQPAPSPSEYNPPAPVIPSAPVPAGQSAAAGAIGTKPKKNWLAIGCLGMSLISCITYPYILGILAIVIGAGALYTGRKLTGKVPALALIGILIAVGSMVLNFYYLDLFAPHLLPPHA